MTGYTPLHDLGADPGTAGPHPFGRTLYERAAETQEACRSA